MDRPREQRVHADAERGVVHLHRAREREDRTLGGRVARAVGETDLRDRRGHVDDRAGAALEHVRHDELGDQEHAPDVHRHHAIPDVGRGLVHRADPADAGVVEEDIDAAVSGTYRVDEEVEIARITRVAAYTGDTAADFADCVVELVFAAAGDVDVSAFGDEECGCGQSHACGGSGDDCDLSMQFCHGRVFLCALIIGVPGCQPRLLSRSLVGAPTTTAGSRHRGLE